MKLYGKFAGLFQKQLEEPFSLYAPSNENWDSTTSYRFVENGIESKVGRNKWQSWGRDISILIRWLLDGKLVVVPNWNNLYKANMVKMKQIADGKCGEDTPEFAEKHLAYVKKILRKLPVQPVVEASKKSVAVQKYISLTFFKNDCLLEFRILEDNTIWLWTIGGEYGCGFINEKEMVEYIKDFWLDDNSERNEIK